MSSRELLLKLHDKLGRKLLERNFPIPDEYFNLDVETITVMLRLKVKPFIDDVDALKKNYIHLLPAGITYTPDDEELVKKYAVAMCELV